ncbi:MAG: hypothetical protein HY263_00795 [Chloroflexi bacterium]|nr:hypothetical protein [Chloroflexota bacterium]
MAAPRLEPFRPTPRERGLPHALKDPVRLALVVAGVLLLVGSLLSWIAVFLPGHGWSEVSSFERAGDGAIILELGLIIAVLAWADRVSESRQPIAVVLPLILALAAVLVMKLGWDQAQEYLDSLKNGGGHGYMLPGFWIALGGAGLAVAGAAAAVIRARKEVRFEVRVSRATAVSVLGGTAGAVVGIGAAIVLGEDFGTNATVTGSAVTFLSIVLGIVGAWLGSRIGRAFGGVDDGDPFDRDRGA